MRRRQAAAVAAAVQHQLYIIKKDIHLYFYVKAGKYFPALIFPMKKTAITIFIVMFTTAFSLNGYCQKPGGEQDRILVAAESIFKAMKKRDYPKIWSLLTNVSRNYIVDDILKEESRRGGQYSKEAIHDDLAKGGGLAKAYWNSYLEVFNPDIILEQSKWEMGEVEKERAEIIMKYKKSDRPARLQMSKENGIWKVGLEETFRPTRR